MLRVEDHSSGIERYGGNRRGDHEIYDCRRRATWLWLDPEYDRIDYPVEINFLLAAVNSQNPRIHKIDAGIEGAAKLELGCPGAPCNEDVDSGSEERRLLRQALDRLLS